MSEFNTGLPPAGEAALYIYGKAGDRTTWKVWNGEFFHPGHYDVHDALRESVRGAYQWIDGMRLATVADLTAAGIPESEARGMVHKSMLPEAAADAEWGPLIEHKTGEACPIPAVKAGDYRVRFTDGTTTRPVCDAVRHGAWAPLGLDIFSTGKAPTRIAAYCLKIEAKPAIAATCEPTDSLTRDALEDEAAAMNAAMIERDLRADTVYTCDFLCRTDAPKPAEPTPWHLRCAPWTNRFGGWRA